MTERFGGVTDKGRPLTLLGNSLEVGQTAPDFRLHNASLECVTLANSADKIRLISVVPSLDTRICNMQTRRFNEEAAAFGVKVAILTVSAEHPFNQQRWCAAAGIDRVQILSDHNDINFGLAYGVAIKEWRLLQRAIFVIDQTGLITYLEYVPKIDQHPNYDSALAALMQATLR